MPIGSRTVPASIASCASARGCLRSPTISLVFALCVADELLTLDVEKPAAGGRMLARHRGQVVLVWGAIPGERVRARIERSGKGVLFAETVDVLSPSQDRRIAT